MSFKLESKGPHKLPIPFGGPLKDKLFSLQLAFTCALTITTYMTAKIFEQM